MTINFSFIKKRKDNVASFRNVRPYDFWEFQKAIHVRPFRIILLLFLSEKNKTSNDIVAGDGCHLNKHVALFVLSGKSDGFDRLENGLEKV